MNDAILIEAKKLYDVGFAIHWLHHKSKRPIDSGWTTGPRKDWKHLVSNYKKGMNVGVRLGTPSKIKNDFLALIDVDVKSKDAKHRQEVTNRVQQLIGDVTLPEVISGRGNDSRHYYILTPEPLSPFRAAQSTDLVKVSMPSTAPSKRDLRMLTQDEIAQGYRVRPAWEVSIMGDGQQVVLPPSTHPDSGKNYKWSRPFNPKEALQIDVKRIKRPEVESKTVGVDAPTRPGPKGLENFTPVNVEISWLPISDRIREMILTGEGVEDRSASLLPIASELVKAGLTQNEVLSVLTNKDTFIGKCGYEHAKTNNRARAAAWVYKYSVHKIQRAVSAEGIFDSPIIEAKKQSSEKILADQETFDTEWDWRNDLSTTKSGNVQGTLRNIILILENVIGDDFLGRDLFSNRDLYFMATPWGGKENEITSDDDVKQLKLWLSNNFSFEPSKNEISDALDIVAIRNAFNPVADWLNGLPNWDGVARLDSWLIEYFEAKGDKEYLAQVFRKWMVALVARVLNPGFKFDWMPIFEGVQGIGKSSFGRILAGEKYFRDSLPDLHDKEAALDLQGIWIVEFGELATLRKNELEVVKSFLTRTVDKVRAPYGKRWLESRRSCIFFGTTNHENYLRDETGNRRFKPVKVGNLDFEALERDREQLFAEALWLFKTGFESAKTLEISGTAKTYEEAIQKEKMVADDSILMAESIQDFIAENDKKNGAEKFDFSRFKLADLFAQNQVIGSFLTYHLPLKNWKYDARNAQLAAKALKHLGFKKTIRDGRNYWKMG